MVGELVFREGVPEFERKDGWVRTTKFYDANCENGHSRFVDSGNSLCTEENGIRDGKFAEWVNLSDLDENRPADPATTATVAEKLVAQSDDFNLYRQQFVKAAEGLIASGRCAAADFETQGGWTKSVNQRSEPVYFVWCGSKKVYLNVQTGEIS